MLRCLLPNKLQRPPTSKHSKNMTKLLLVGTLLCCAFTTAKNSPWFSGRIVYRNEFQNVAGEPVAGRPGAETCYYFQGDNYKAYAPDHSMSELYTGKTHTLLKFENGQASEAAAESGPELVLTRLPATAVILGYPCQALQLVQGGLRCVVYYSPALRVNPQGFRSYPAGFWYAVLKATDGALPLRTIAVNAEQDFTGTSEATAVQAMDLTAADFAPGAPAR